MAISLWRCDPDAGWLLSPADDVNPNPDGGAGLKLNVSAVSNELDLRLALAVTPYYRLDQAQARDIVKEVKEITSQWRAVAQQLGLPSREIKEMAPAFRLADAGRL
jgi:serine/threonine-protein kinase HipA